MEDGGARLHHDDGDLSTFFGQSSFGTFAVAQARNVKVDPEVDIALLGPLGCGIQTGAGTVLNRLKPGFGSSIAVFGCGAVGLSAVMAAGSPAARGSSRSTSTTAGWSWRSSSAPPTPSTAARWTW